MWSGSRLGEQGRSLVLRVRWGEKSLAALFVSALSGIILSLQYDPAAPFYSVASLDLLVPFGAFWRSLHFYSSQLFFLFSFVHFFAILLEKWPPVLPASKWIRLVFSLPALILLLFTGYVLRGDITGESAGRIAENITLAVPLIGGWTNELLFSITDEGLKRVYANHLIGLVVLWGALSWEHVKRFRIDWQRQGVLLAGLLGFCLLVPAPLEQAQLGIFYVAGPWFFLGLQELLRHLPAFWAGVIFPVSVFMALALFPSASRDRRRAALLYVLCWLALYAVLSLVGLARG